MIFDTKKRGLLPLHYSKCVDFQALFIVSATIVSTCAGGFVYLLFCRVGCLLLIRNSVDCLADFIFEDVLGRIDVVLLLRLEEELDLVRVVPFPHDGLFDHRLEQVAVELLDLVSFFDHFFDGR